jgi:hypothetical protein
VLQHCDESPSAQLRSTGANWLPLHPKLTSACCIGSGRRCCGWVKVNASGSGASPGPKDTNLDNTDWVQSIPAYLQSTRVSESCGFKESESEVEAPAAAQGATGNLSPEECCGPDVIWQQIRAEVTKDIEREPILSSFLFTSVLSHRTFAEALSFVLSNRIADQTLLPTQLFSLFVQLTQMHPRLLHCAASDLHAFFERVCPLMLCHVRTVSHRYPLCQHGPMLRDAPMETSLTETVSQCTVHCRARKSQSETQV